MRGLSSVRGRRRRVAVSVWVLAALIALASGGGRAESDSWVPVGLTAAFWLDADVSRAAQEAAPEGSVIQRANAVMSDVIAPAGVLLSLGALYNSDRQAADVAVRALAGTGALTYGLKIVVGRARPDSGRVGLKGLTVWDDAWHSFPSGHTSMAFAAATLVAEYYPKWREEAYLLAGLVGLSRVVLGRHWPSDVAAGALLGTAVARSFTAKGTVWEWRW